MTTFTPRMITVFQRAVEVVWEKVSKQLTRITDEEDEDELHKDSRHVITFNDVVLEYDFAFDEHYNDNHSCSIEWDSIYVYFELRPKKGYNQDIGYIISTKKDLDGVKGQIGKQEGKTFTLCECNIRWAEKDGFCMECYALAQSRDDNCPICLDNNIAVWIELPCSHVFHKTCWKKHHLSAVRDNGGRSACPLCRGKAHCADIKEI